MPEAKTDTFNIGTPLAQNISKIGQFLRELVRHPLAALGLTIIVLVTIVAVLAPVLAPYNPSDQNIAYRLLPPMMESTKGLHVLGTDPLGRDILSRLIYGSRISLLVGITSVLVSGGVGVMLGLISGYRGKTVDAVIMRLADVQLAIPFLVLALAIIAVLGNSLTNVIVVMGLTGWMNYARVVRAEVLALKEKEFIQACYAIGVPEWLVLWRHILPNVFSSVLVIATLQVARMIIFEASLSFLGLGVPPSIPTWGAMVADGRNYLSIAWWISTIPGLAIALLVLGINMVGDRVRDLLDPRLSGEGV